MNLLSRYLAAAWARMLLICLSGFLITYLILDIMEKLGRFMKAEASAGTISLYFLYKLPEMLGQAMPFAVLMATLLTLGMLSRSSELTAMRSCGRSFSQIVRPLLGLGLFCSLFLLVNAELLVPAGYKQMEYVDKILIRKRDSSAVFRLNNIWFKSGNLMLQAKAFDPQQQLLRGVTVWDLSEQMVPVRRMDAEQAVPATAGWELQQVQLRSFGTSGSNALQQLPRLHLPLALKSDDLRVLDNKADNLSFRELRDYAVSLEKGGYSASRYLTMMHSKLADPFGAVVMVVLGVPFALKTGRSGGVARGVGAGVAIGFIYFILNAAIQSYGRSGALPPVAAAWGANLVFVLSGIWLAMTVRQQ